MKKIIKSFRPVIIPLIVCLVISQVQLPPVSAEEITITTYYPSPSGSYLDLNAQGTLLIGTGIPDATLSSPRIEFTHNNASTSRHWNIDQAFSNTSNPHLRFFTETNNNGGSRDRLVIDNTSITFNNSGGIQRLVVDDDNILFTGTAGSGNILLRAPTSDPTDPGDIVFQRSNGIQLGRIWAMHQSNDNVLRLSASVDNNQPVEIRESGSGTFLFPYKNDLHVTNGNLYIDNVLEWTGFANRVWATLIVEVAIISLLYEWFSSIRFKENVVPIDNALEKVMKLQGVYFNWKKDFRPNDRNRKMGLILEEVQPIVPEVVLPAKDGKKPEVLAYPNLVALLIEAIKEQQGEIVKQQKQIDELKQRIDKISSKK